MKKRSKKLLSVSVAPNSVVEARSNEQKFFASFFQKRRFFLTASDWVRPADAAPDMAPEIDVRARRRAAGMTQAAFAMAYACSIRTVQEWEGGAKRPRGPARTLLRAIKADPERLRRALAVG